MIKRSALSGAVLVACNVAALAQTTVLGPVTTSVTAGTAATLAALASNPARKALTICNGSATSTVAFTTGSVTPVSNTVGIVLQTGNVATSCFTIGAPGLAGSGGVGAAINIIASSAGVPVTFVEYF
jgi:hypothetical protein